MLESISWSDFVLSLAAAAALYYTVVLILFFSHDIARLVRGSVTIAKEPNPAPSGKSEINLVGDTRSTHINERDEDTSIDESTQVVAGEPESQEDTTWNADPIVTNPLHRSFSQLVEEVNALAYILAHNSKEEISLLFETLLARYPQLAKAHYQASINQFIIEACEQYGEIKLSPAEIDSWWANALDSTTHP